jgi:trans-4-hydroxy-L-proline dehydratase
VNTRVETLRKRSLDARPSVSAERAVLLTEFYQQKIGQVSTPVQRALAFQYIMENKSIYIGDDELIVGERGPFPKATPTYPEICCHSLEDLDLLNSRELIPYSVSPDVRKTYADTIIPFWRDRSIRDVIFREMADEWETAYESGLFTEFMEQRAPGHTVLDGKIYRHGLLEYKGLIQSRIQLLDFLFDQQAYQKREELKAMEICVDAVVRFAERHAALARSMAKEEANPHRKRELERIAEVCSRVPAHAPRDFWEALQSYWFVHLGVITEMNTWDAFNPGRLDQHLLPFYQKGLADGTLDREGARELLSCFWVKFNNQPAPPKVGVTAEESGTYTDFANINVGGLTEDGSDGVNDVSYLLLEVIGEMRLLQPSSNLQLSKKNPDRFLKSACRIIRTGFGQPSIFNADLIFQELMRQGKSVKDARNGGASGCVEVGAFGKESYILTGYFNLVKVLELTLHNGLDPLTGKRIGPATGDPTQWCSFDELWDAYRTQLTYLVDVKVRGNNVIERLYATYLPVPFLSLIIDDCIQSGRDYHDGGARYNTNYIQGVGLGTLTDSLAAIQYHVYDRGDLTMEQLLGALESDFAGHERLRLELLNRTPKYGNDDDYADDLMRAAFEAYYEAVNGRPNTKGGRYAVNMLPTTCHIYFGRVVGATPDGRRAAQPVSEGVSPVQGADRHGPTAVVRSVAKMDQVRTGGTLLNQKFTPQLLADETGIGKLADLVRGYFKLDGHHIQFNVVDAATLRSAQEHPEQYRDLIVRVAGYSDYFCDLGKTLQDEIIARTEHESF